MLRIYARDPSSRLKLILRNHRNESLQVEGILTIYQELVRAARNWSLSLMLRIRSALYQRAEGGEALRLDALIINRDGSSN